MEQSPAIKTAIDSSILFFIQAAFIIAACKYTFTDTYTAISQNSVEVHDIIDARLRAASPIVRLLTQSRMGNNGKIQEQNASKSGIMTLLS